jgi:FAD/FMN-containing dehydrogenase
MSIAGFAGEALTESDAAYSEERFGWNHMIDRKPALIAKCTSVEDVVAAVKHAAAAGLKAVARCGGHSVSGASLPEGGMVIDLSGLNSVTVDPARKRAQVAGGALLGDLDAATQAHGLAVTAGVEPSTGAGGLTLGGGIGFLARKLGLTIDNLLGAQVVLADGSVVEANDTEHPDLFWAIRGGGGQFGIVTRFDLALHGIGPDVIVSQAWYPLSKAHDVMRFLEAKMVDAPDELGLVPAMLKVPPVEPFPAEFHGQLAIAMVGCHVGDEEQAKADLQPCLELGDMIFGFVGSQPYVDFQRTFADASPKGGRYYWKSIFVEELTDDLVDVLVDGAKSIPGEYTQIFMEALGGAVGRVGATDTAFSNRRARWNLGISTGWIDPALDQEAVAATRAWAERLKPYSDGTVYLNYLDRDEVDRVTAGFGPNYERLCAVKAQYDPNSLFGGALGGAG